MENKTTFNSLNQWLKDLRATLPNESESYRNGTPSDKSNHSKDTTVSLAKLRSNI